MNDYTLPEMKLMPVGITATPAVPGLHRQPDHVAGTGKFQNLQQQWLTSQKQAKTDTKTDIQHQLSANQPKNEPRAFANTVTRAPDHHKQVCGPGGTYHQDDENQQVEISFNHPVSDVCQGNAHYQMHSPAFHRRPAQLYCPCAHKN